MIASYNSLSCSMYANSSSTTTFKVSPRTVSGLLGRASITDPFRKNEPPLPRRTLKHFPPEPRQESGDLVYHLQALPLARSNNRRPEPFTGDSVEEDGDCHSEAFATLPRPASQDEMTLVTQELLLIDGGLEPQMLEELDHVSLVD